MDDRSIKLYPRVDKRGGHKPPRVDVETRHIPAELANIDRWVCWKWELRSSKWTKPPYDAQTGKRAEANNPSTWSSYSQAMASFRQNKEYAGVGFMFSADDDLTGVDVDGCILDDGTLTDTGRAAVRRFGDSYCEVSPSGTGLKFLIRGHLPCDKAGRKNPKLDVECYQSGRYFTVTGRLWEGSQSCILNKQDDLNQWFADVFGTAKTDDKNDKSPSTPFFATVQEIVDKASASKNGDRFRRLWAGDCGDHSDDHSSADLALCSMLAFWCGRDPRLIDDCFRASGLGCDPVLRTDFGCLGEPLIG